MEQREGAVRFLFAFILVLGGLSLAFIFFDEAGEQGHWLLLVITAVLLLAGWQGVARYRAAKCWAPVEAELLSIEEQWEDVPQLYSPLRYFYPAVDYRYSYGGRQYRGQRVSFERENVWVPEVNGFGGPIPARQRFWHEWKVGDRVTAYVNTRNPAESVLIRAPHKSRCSHHLALAAGAVIIALLWGLLFFLVLA